MDEFSCAYTQFGSVNTQCLFYLKLQFYKLHFNFFTAEKYKDSVPDNTKNADNAAKNAEPLINLDGKCINA